MKNGLYSVSLKGFYGEDWPPGGVAVLLDGVILGGGSYTHYTGSYSFKDGIFKGEIVVNQHNFPPPSHVFFNAKNVGIGVSGTYEDDQAELTGIALVGNRSLTLHVTLLRLAELETSSSAPRPVVSRRAIGQLVELGLKGSARPPVGKPGRRLRARELAREAIDKMEDATAAPEERVQRRRRLTKGPLEFREDRVDQPKAKGK
jgi:T3SS negative regulator,GrlR